MNIENLVLSGTRLSLRTVRTPGRTVKTYKIKWRSFSLLLAGSVRHSRYRSSSFRFRPMTKIYTRHILVFSKMVKSLENGKGGGGIFVRILSVATRARSRPKKARSMEFNLGPSYVGPKAKSRLSNC
ncbi:hypothetical protein RvY_17693 [Ramazzottius varieornatus]|uniref:Uncharacterized protein n=1 Tax=Ramazzottius varieornatus TaxID=947166 RepID=A0A1D1W317_RAMVA|nr:hypothetical protein RvY_17693 [Ramazzottius varieornatus]